MPRPSAHKNFEVRRILSVISTVHSDTLFVKTPPNSLTNLTSGGLSYPVIIITGLDFFRETTEGISASGGFDNFLLFPVPVEDLAAVDFLEATVHNNVSLDEFVYGFIVIIIKNSSKSLLNINSGVNFSPF